MNWPRGTKPAFKVHYPAADVNSLGFAQPACKHIGGFHTKPTVTRVMDDVTCQRCMRISRKLRAV